MKTSVLLILVFIIFLPSKYVAAQDVNDSSKKKLNLQYIIQKFDGNVFVGKIIYEDPRAIQLHVKKLGDIYILKNDIEIMKVYNHKELSLHTDLLENEVFSNTYFITSSMLPFQQHESFTQWNWYGPDIHFAIKNNFEVSVLSSWVVLPIVSNIKYGIKISENASMGIGALMGWGSWAYPDCSGAFSYASFSFGNRTSNITFSGGYGLLTIYGNLEYSSLFSCAGILKVSKRTSLVFDSFVLPSNTSGSSSFALIIPGIRILADNGTAFQLGLGGLFLDWQFTTTPIPFVQLFKKI